MKNRSRFRSRPWHAAVAFCAAVKTLTPALHAAPLDHGFVEACTLANVQESELECEVCASAAGSRGCQERLTPRGFTKTCRTRGTHAGWDEIWCARRGAPASPGPSQSHSDAALLVGGAAATLGAMVLVIRMLSGKPRKK